MKLNMYDRTQKKKLSKWMKIFLCSFFIILATIFFIVAILISIHYQKISPILFTFIFIFLLTIVLTAYSYNILNAYIETENEIIKIIDYPFFKKRYRFILLSDIKKVNLCCGSGLGSFPMIEFKDNKNKTLFRTIYVPETKTYFEYLGFKIE